MGQIVPKKTAEIPMAGALGRHWWDSRPHVLGFLGLLAGLSLSGYLIFSATIYRAGFPLDDAWIHQTYARNLAATGKLAFIPGQPSAGSTAPAWSALLAVGHLLGIGDLAWAALLGWLLLWVAAYGTYAGFSLLGPPGKVWGLAAGVLVTLEWHMVWAAGAGMETLLQAALFIIIIFYLLKLESDQHNDLPGGRKALNWLLAGALVGLCVWVCPDGLTLIGPVGWVILFGAWTWRSKIRIAMMFLFGACLLLLPYLAMNLNLAGEIWPNTFYAKQAEYATLRSAPFHQRFLAEFVLPLIGVGVILMPGLLLKVYFCLKSREYPPLGGVLWMLGYLGIYSALLPVTYQHGRYVIPAMPVYFVYGFAGLANWFERSHRPGAHRLLARSWLAACCAVLACFWWIGARSYAWDVAVIESEMVDTARWVAENTEPGARLAAHDIGALGYFGGRPIVDLAGLVSPEVIPIIRDEPALREFLVQQDIQYLVTFPGWYPILAGDFQPVYTSSGAFSPRLGGENMAVYRWISAPALTRIPGD